MKYLLFLFIALFLFLHQYGKGTTEPAKGKKYAYIELIDHTTPNGIKP